MSKQTHHVVLLLDRSGSMGSYVPVTIKGVNEVLATAKNVQKETGADIKVTMVGFESHSELMEGYDAVSVKKIKPVGTSEVFARGGTQMYDGIGYTLKHLLGTVKDGDTVFVGIFTDGDTGGDHLTPAQTKKLIEASGSTFAFLTPKSYYGRGGLGGVGKGRIIGIPESNVMEYEHSQNGFRSAFYKLSRGLRNYLKRVIDHDGGEFRLDGFFEGVDPLNATMKVNGLEVTMNMPESLTGDTEKKNGELPGYAPVDAHVVDEYPACPSNWMNGSSKASSYFVAVKEGHGMWLDFNKLQQDEHDIAVVISVQGINPITGQKTEALRLEKYEKNCPVHKTEFGQEHFCKDCGFKWPSQNYISTNAAPNGQLWLDGFRASDGKVRQYIFTEEQARGVAKAVIGDDRVFAIGIAFFKSKEKKPQQQNYGFLRDASPTLAMSFGGTGATRARGLTKASLCNMRSVSKGGGSSGLEATFSLNSSVSSSSMSSNSSSSDKDMGFVGYAAMGGGAAAASADADTTLYQTAPVMMDMFDGDVAEVATNASIAQVQTKSFEVGAGESIDQSVHTDTNSMEYWQDEPYAMLYVNYADEESVKKILAAGKRREVTEGFLAGLPVGN